MSLIKGKSPFKEQHLKDEYYHKARQEYIDILKFIGSKGIPLSQDAVEAIKLSVKQHYTNIQEF
jgi:hypothetical protein